MLRKCKIQRLLSDQKENNMISSCLLPDNTTIFGLTKRNPIEAHWAIIRDNSYYYARDHKFYHLYILSDDKINLNDWVYCSLIKDIFMCQSTITETMNKVIASTNPDLNLPKPSSAFIQKYCELGGIDEVMVEYIDTSHVKCDFLYSGIFPKVSLDNIITIKAVKNSFSRDEIKEILAKIDSIFHMHTADWFNQNY